MTALAGLVQGWEWLLVAGLGSDVEGHETVQSAPYSEGHGGAVQEPIRNPTFQMNRDPIRSLGERRRQNHEREGHYEAKDPNNDTIGCAVGIIRAAGKTGSPRTWKSLWKSGTLFPPRYSTVAPASDTSLVGEANTMVGASEGTPGLRP